MLISPSKRIVRIKSTPVIFVAKIKSPKIVKNRPIISPRIIRNQPVISPRVFKRYGKIIRKKAVIEKCVPIKPKRTVEVSYESVLALITELIEDSKENLLTQKVTCKYFIDSRNFLMNKNGLLAYYLEHINNIDVSQCLKILFDYAEYGYLENREIE
jgi:hypothetical protein